jgi:hypothetical protein
MMWKFRCAGAALLIAMATFVAAPAATAEPATAPTKATRINDIDGDRKLDLVFVNGGAWANPDDNQPGRVGSVQVLFGDGKFQQVTTTQLHDRLFEDSQFGSALVVGDLNRDGYADIVVADQFALEYRGRVWALWGSAAGISASRTTVLATGGQGIGHSLAFVPLPEPVLAIGATVADAHVDLYRVRNDGRLGERRRITIGSPGIAGRNFEETVFGESLSASGDLLVIGAPEAGAIWTAGAVYVLQLQPGLRYWATRVMQGSRGVPGAQEDFDAFGQAVSVLDDRVAIGVPSEQLGVHETAGAIQLLRVERTGHGLSIHPGRLLTQASPGVPGDIGDIHVFGGEVLVTRLCALGYGVISADHASERLLSVPFVAGACSSGWLSADHTADPANPGPPPVSVLRRSVDGVAVDEPVIAVDDYTLEIGWPGSITRTDLKGKARAAVRLVALPAA